MGAFIGVCVLLILGIFMLVTYVFEAPKRTALVEHILRKHASALARKRMQLITTDAYGNENTTRWEKEKKYFVKNVLKARLEQKDFLWINEEELYNLVEQAAIFGGQQLQITDISHITSGTDYEHFCADLLQQAGWDVRVTKASGDQGVDIIGTAPGSDKTAVFQCKFHTKPVGNKAVQEIVAAKIYEGAHAAAVISNAPFTRSAEELAKTTEVVLLHHDDIATKLRIT